MSVTRQHASTPGYQHVTALASDSPLWRHSQLTSDVTPLCHVLDMASTAFCLLVIVFAQLIVTLPVLEFFCILCYFLPLTPFLLTIFPPLKVPQLDTLVYFFFFVNFSDTRSVVETAGRSTSDYQFMGNGLYFISFHLFIHSPTGSPTEWRSFTACTRLTKYKTKRKHVLRKVYCS